MTLIAAFRCPHAVVVCSDTQETEESGLVSKVKKIWPEDANHYQIVAGGSGDYGPLIDCFTQLLRDEVSAWEVGLDKPQMRKKLAAFLVEYYEGTVAFHQGAHKSMDFIVVIKRKAQGDIVIWQMQDTAIWEQPEMAVIGINAPAYQYEIKRLYRPDASPFQCVLLCAHLLLFATETTKYVGFEPTIVGLWDKAKWAGMESKIKDAMLTSQTESWVEEDDHITLLVGLMRELNRVFAEMLRQCTNFSLSSEKYSEIIDDLKNQIIKVREGYIEYAMQQHFSTMLDAVKETDAWFELVKSPYFKGLGPPYFNFPDSWKRDETKKSSQILDELMDLPDKKPPLDEIFKNEK
jgi:20S proteasome alpha/beta subunit